MNPTLVILAAGMGSRFGGLKQITPITSSGESIIDFSIYDAIRSGYDRVIIIIREDIYSEFQKFFGARLEKHIELEYAFQETDKSIAPNRQKPFGTAHAVLSSASLIEGPFSVINADDYYGLESFQKSAEFLATSQNPYEHSVIGYNIESTLSDFGSVSRAVCEVDDNKNLLQVKELLSIYRKNKDILHSDGDKEYLIKPNTLVSMNFWNFNQGVLEYFKMYWEKFLNLLKTQSDVEFLIPEVVNNMIGNNQGSMKVIPTNSPWFGITYKEDFEKVQSGIHDLTHSGLYSSPLWN